MLPMNRKLPRPSTVCLLTTLCLAAWFAFGRPAPQPQPAHAAVQATTAARVPAGKPVSRIKPIAEAQLGERTLGKNPLREQVETVEPDPQTWRKIRLQMSKDNGLKLWVELLRPLDWLAEYDAEPGRAIFLDLEEMGAVGDAEVTAIEACPPIQSGKGAVITGKFIHESHGKNVVLLRIEGQDEATGVTTNHPYWSEDRQDYVSVGQLREGELLDTEFGPRRVVSVTPHANYTGLLYNLETTEHVYRVGSLGSLAHNTCAGQHHFFPMSWGNNIPYKHSVLNRLDKDQHTRIHKAWSDFLERREGKRFQSLSGKDWRNRLKPNERNKLVHDFHREYADTPEGIELAKSLTKGTDLSLYDIFKAEYMYAIRNGFLSLEE